MVHPVDKYVGRKIREVRLIRGLTQANVAARLGLSFQQLQKYETGHNRVSASKLFELSQLLNVAPSYFFEGLTQAGEAPGALLDDQTARAAMALSNIADERIKTRLQSMIHEIAGQSAAQA